MSGELPVNPGELARSARIERFREGNDRVWGEGNWVACDQCLDSSGQFSFHHKDFHVPPGSDRRILRLIDKRIQELG